MTHNWTIYMYTFPNGKRYIGATKRPLHLRQGSAESGWARYKNCRLVWEAIQEFGIENIQQTVLFEGEISDREAAEMEKHYIALYKTNANRYSNPSYGYNLGDGGEGTSQRNLSDERKRELADQLLSLKQKRIGSHPSRETRRRQSIAKKGKPGHPLSEETRRKIGLANSLEMISDEERQHRSDSKKQPVLVTNPVTGEHISFNSGEEAADFFGVRPSAVSRWIDGSRNPRNGYRFQKAVVGGVV